MCFFLCSDSFCKVIRIEHLISSYLHLFETIKPNKVNLANQMALALIEYWQRNTGTFLSKTQGNSSDLFNRLVIPRPSFFHRRLTQILLLFKLLSSLQK